MNHVPLEARFPLELERAIFELCARSRPPTIPGLLRVAHRVRAWLEPLLYEMLRLTEASRTPGILDAVLAKPAAHQENVWGP
ncbi:hypothetical protein C8R44DRAFT_803721 [Mycena epipterygia]|nr:hypothetical protein C8R44DRAFT_803721 [Mycena epipterygia]